MPSIKKRGDSYRIMVSLGYDMEGKQVRKTTTFTPPEGVTPAKQKNWRFPMLMNLRNAVWAW